jgi:UDP-N-acetylglucosamine transferase subunit ALG13
VIFVTVGTELPFDRLVRAMDAWAAASGEEVLAQIGAGRYQPAHLRWVRRLDRSDYAAAIAGAELVVAHAGVGSVVAAGEHAKPVVLLPRRARFGEQRNDHQLDTVAWLGGRPGVHVAADEAALPATIAAARAAHIRAVPSAAPPDFLGRLRSFVLG